MICKKCENQINSGTKCFQCGHDNNIEPMTKSAASAKYKRGPVLIVTMALFIVLGIINTLSTAGVIWHMTAWPTLSVMLYQLYYLLGIPTDIFIISLPGLHPLVLAVLMTAATAVDIVMCVFVIRLKKWAFKAYVILTVAEAITRAFYLLFVAPWLIFRMMIPFLLKGVALVVVYMADGKAFGGAAINETASAILARKRME